MTSEVCSTCDSSYCPLIIDADQMIFSSAHAATICVEVCIALIFCFILSDTYFSAEELSTRKIDGWPSGYDRRYANLPLPSRKPFVTVQQIYRLAGPSSILHLKDASPPTSFRLRYKTVTKLGTLRNSIIAGGG